MNSTQSRPAKTLYDYLPLDGVLLAFGGILLAINELGDGSLRHIHIGAPNGVAASDLPWLFVPVGTILLLFRIARLVRKRIVARERR